MISIQIDEITAEGLERNASSVGLSITDYLRSLVNPPTADPRLSWDELESQFVSLSTDSPSLPADFSRADIYMDHD